MYLEYYTECIVCISYMPLFGMHEMHGRMHSKQGRL